MLAGGAAPAGVIRSVISDSWRRSRTAGVDADGGLAPVLDHGDARARWREHPVSNAVTAAKALLSDVGSSDHQMLLFCDADGTLLWSDGDAEVVRRAREARLELGAVWSEQAAGTNAMGTALATDHPVQVFSAEHYAWPVHSWTCSAAPVRDPETGRTLGVLDLSGGIQTAHPHSLAVVSAAAQVVEQELQRLADEAAGRLVNTYGSRVGSGPSGPDALATANGRVLVSARGWLDGRRLVLPPAGGAAMTADGRSVMAEALHGGGYLLWIVGDPGAEAATAQLEALGRDTAQLTINGRAETLSRRHSELLVLLTLRPQGWSAEALCDALLGPSGKTVTIRAELSRLRRVLGPLLASQPYRLTIPVQTDFARAERLLEAHDLQGALDGMAAGELLPGSDIPLINELRFRLTMGVREAVVSAADPELLASWLRLPAGYDDLHACRELIMLTPPSDPRHVLAAGRLRRLASLR